MQIKLRIAALLFAVMGLLVPIGDAFARPSVASWYGPGLIGNLTASGEVFTGVSGTCAHREYPFGTLLLVSYAGKSEVCRVNDRGPFANGAEVDVDSVTADALGLKGVGVDGVDVEPIFIPSG